MPPVRLGAVEYLNARPLVYGLADSPRFSLRFDLPSRCADLLHAGAVDLGLIPSIEFARGAEGGNSYAIVPDLAIASDGPVTSVAIYTTRSIEDVRSIALDTSSRTSVALVRVLCGRVFGIAPALEGRGPDLGDMLLSSDAALIIGDNALLQDAGEIPRSDGTLVTVEKIDLGEVWARTTGLPFVYAFWAGRPGCLAAGDVEELQRVRDRGIEHPEDIARAYFPDSASRQAVGADYLRDNIKYSLGARERAGLEAFYRYAEEAGVIGRVNVRFY
jgi:chorismate dehydratase